MQIEDEVHVLRHESAELDRQIKEEQKELEKLNEDILEAKIRQIVIEELMRYLL